MDLFIPILLIGAGLAYLGRSFFAGLLRGYAGTDATQFTHQPPPRRTKTPYVLNPGPLPALIEMPEPTSRLFTYRDERAAFQARQPLWISYRDKVGHVTERIVEIYHPEDDEVIFAWCRLKQEPRTFARRNFERWQLIPERVRFDPIVAQYWEEEATRDLTEKLPWRRWLEQQPAEIRARYVA